MGYIKAGLLFILLASTLVALLVMLFNYIRVPTKVLYGESPPDPNCPNCKGTDRVWCIDEYIDCPCTIKLYY